MLNKVKHFGSGCPGKPRFRPAKTWLAFKAVDKYFEYTFWQKMVNQDQFKYPKKLLCKLNNTA